MIDINTENNPSFLTDQQKKEFECNGFLVLESILDKEEILHYKSIISSMRKKIQKHLYGELENQKRAYNDLLELRNAVSHCNDLIELMIHPKAFPLVVDLMGPHINLITSHIFYRPPTPSKNKEFKQIDWHRDGPSKNQLPCNGKFPWLYTKIGYFFSDLTIENAGALRVVPGSHRYDSIPPKKANNIDPYGTIEVKVPAGSAVIFDNRVYHAVGPNYSDIARENIYFGYGWRYLRPIDYNFQTKELLNKCNPIQRQLLGDAITDLSFYLPQEVDVPLDKWQENRWESK